jgi:hypothetical protein
MTTTTILDLSAQRLHTSAKALQSRLKSREFLDPEVTISVSTKDWRTTNLDVSFKVRDDSIHTYKSFYGEDPAKLDDLIAEAHTYIESLKSKAELEHEEFMLMLGRVMDRAKDMGLDEHFINPLTAMMKELASNALENHA